MVHFDVDDRVATIRLDRPAKRNAVNAEVTRELERAIDRLEDDDQIWVGVISANVDGQPRPVFSAGADLAAIQRGGVEQLYTVRGGFAGFVDRSREKPVIAAVDGAALAGGCEIVLACDLVVASTRSSFGLPEVRRSLVAASGGMYRLPRLIGMNLAMETLLTGEALSAERLHDVGFVNRLVEPGQAELEARRLAGQIAAGAPMAVRWSRRVALASADGADRELREMSQRAQREVLTTADAAEGVAAFLERRQPVWRGH